MSSESLIEQRSWWNQYRKRRKEEEIEEDEDFDLLMERWRRSGRTKLRKKRSPNKPRDHLKGHLNIVKDYLAPNSVFDDMDFRRRFRMGRDMFERIVRTCVQHDDYFVQKADAFGRVGLSAIQKVTAVLRVFAYGYSVDAVTFLSKLFSSFSG
jgi:hypothetical protein